VNIVPDPNNANGPPLINIPLTPTDYEDSGKKPGTYCVTLKATNSEDLTNLP